MAKEIAAHPLPDASMERLRATWIHRLLSLAAPWAVALGAWLAADHAHQAWGGRGLATAAAVAGFTAGTLIVAAAAWAALRHRPVLLRAHSALSAVAGGAWACLATVTGPGARGTSYLGLLAAVTTCLTWNVRRAHVPPQDSGAAAKLSELFADAAEPAGVKGAKMTVGEVSPRKARGIVRLVPGEHTAAELIKRLPNLESGMKIPPGSLTVAENRDRADLAELTLTDPRLMREPIPWPGPSRPGGSIASPVVPGLWQDADPVEWTIPGHHKQIMGMTGAGKSVGGGWSYLGEVITREDAAVLAADITKGDQTMGPLRPALHMFADDLPSARGLLSDVRSIIRPRTDYLASMGLQRWERGCGLTYLVVWLEEVPDIIDALNDKQVEALVSATRAARSAGIELDFSLQRSTWDQLPTILRGQTANWTFGVQNSADARYGLSERQDDGGARPELWQNSQPGMAYLDTPGTDEQRITMPMRCWFWGQDATVMTAHAARYPASQRPLDALTARLLADAAAARLQSAPRTAAARAFAQGQPAATAAPTRPAVTAAPAQASDDGQDDDPGRELPPADPDADDDDDLDPEDDPETVRAEYLTEPDPDPELTAGIDDPITLPPEGDPFRELEFPEPDRMDPAQARELFRQQITDWLEEGRQEFSTSDLYDLLTRTGLSRAWLHKQINLAINDGLIEPVTDAERGRFGRYELREPESGQPCEAA
jgi:hypothetical protein